MLQCWEIDLDERPEFDQLSYLLGDLSQQGNVSQQIKNILAKLVQLGSWYLKNTPAQFRSFDSRRSFRAWTLLFMLKYHNL